MATIKKKIVKKKSANAKTQNKRKHRQTPPTFPWKEEDLLDTKKKKEVVGKKKQFININERDLVLEAKSKIAWMIIGVLMIVLIIFWFWSMKADIKNSSSDTTGLKEISSEITKSIEEFKGIISNSKNIIDQTNEAFTKQQKLEELKKAVLQQIKINLESENWPEHSSELMKMSFQYPQDWIKTENKKIITLSSYDITSDESSVATNPPKVFANIAILKIDNPNNNNLEDLSEELAIEFEDYTKSDEEIFIDLIPGSKYIYNEIINDEILYTIFVENDGYIYKIHVSTKNGTNLFEPIIDKILSSIDLQ